jgi:hypothetical protein
MKLFSKSKDGGRNSTVTGYWLIELKSVFSIVLLCFEKGSRENYHSHAFNALTWFVKGEVEEQHLDGRVITWKASLKPKFTPKKCFHKVFAKERTWAISFRGPWDKTWKEFNPNTDETITLASGRIVVDVHRIN